MIISPPGGLRKCFIHIPRTSGTYLENLICHKYRIKNNWPQAPLCDLFGLYRKTKNNFFTLQHLTYLEIQDFIHEGLVQPGLEFFSVIRNPYDRIISLYRHWGGPARFGNFDLFLSEIEKCKLEQYPHTGIITKRKNFTYLNMTEVLSECKYHFLQQAQYVCDEDYEVKAKIFKFSDIENISSLLEINPQFNNSKRIKNLLLLTPSQRARVQDLYYRDFEIFEYSYEYTEDSEY